LPAYYLADGGLQLYVSAPGRQEGTELVREQVFGIKPIAVPEIKLDLEAASIDLDGVKLPVKSASDRTGQVDGVDRISGRSLLQAYGYIVTDLEQRVLSQLARALKYGSRVVQLQGPSGEGKTEVSRILLSSLISTFGRARSTMIPTSEIPRQDPARPFRPVSVQ